MTYVITTENSVYEINDETKSWARTKNFGDTSWAPLRSEQGTFITRGEIVVGQRVTLFCVPFTSQASARVITTSPAVSVAELCEDEGCPHFGIKHICNSISDEVKP